MKESEAGPPAAEEPTGECNFQIRQSTLDVFYRYVPLEKRSAWIDQAILEQIDRKIQCLITGIQFEERVRGIVVGTKINYRGAGHDILSASGHVLEAKWATLRYVDKNRKYRQWHWRNLLGEKGTYKYDWAILGAPSLEYPGQIVYFDVPIQWILELKGNRRRDLYCTPKLHLRYRTRSTIARDLLRDYRTDETKLKEKYGAKSP